MAEHAGLVTLKGNPVTLVGDELKVGDRAPDFKAHKTLVEAVSLSDYAGKVVVLSVAPSIDTGICAMQLREFNKRAADLHDDVRILNISRDLPFALARFCAAEGIDKVTALSDALWRDMGDKYGIVTKGFNLLARSLWVIGRDGTILHKDINPEWAAEPNYDAALQAAAQAV